MQKISVVIITKNEAHIIGKTLASLQGLTDDIIIGDNGSTDETVAIATSMGAKVEKITWEGFGKTKNKATSKAKYDWIFALDADEEVDEKIKHSILQINLKDPRVLYSIRYRNFIGTSEVKFGEWRGIKKNRLFNRNFTNWSDSEIHETIIIPAGTRIFTLDGFILHHAIKDIQEYAEKKTNYALMMAEKYFANGKKAGWFKLYIYPCFQFLLNYIFRLGILDGRMGFVAAYFSAYYSFLKYHQLKELIDINKNQPEK